MCIQWKRVLYSNPPISQFNSLCNKFTSIWSMFVYTTNDRFGIRVVDTEHIRTKQEVLHVGKSP